MQSSLRQLRDEIEALDSTINQKQYMIDSIASELKTAEDEINATEKKLHNQRETAQIQLAQIE